MNAIVPRNTVEEIVDFRNRALKLYDTAFTKIAEAGEAVKVAHDMARRSHPGIEVGVHTQAEEIKAFFEAVKVPDMARYRRVARRITDINVWRWIIERTDLQRLMDVEAKKQLESQMAYIPERTGRQGELINAEEIARGLPDVTVDNIMATIEKFAGEADMIFRRGIANAFSKLDRRFRSHDGFKIGSRLILTRFFSEYGGINYGEIRDTMIDIERVFSVLDGKPEASFRSALDAVDIDRRGRYGPRQSEVDTDYFKIRGFMNGNAHLWFRRDDLVKKVNQLLAEWYGEVIGDGQTQEEDPLSSPKLTPAKRYGFFPTPDDAAERIIEGASFYIRPLEGDRPLRVLEPSAGTGNLARRCVHNDQPGEDRFGRKIDHVQQTVVDCVEIQPTLAAALTDEGIYNRVFCQDFLSLSPDTTGLYDRIIMNPPFDRERDIDHVVHAMRFLKPKGQLVAIMSAGTEFRETRKAIAFRERMKKLNARWADLPAGSFSEVGTNVNTTMIRFWNNGHDSGWWR